MPGDALRKVPAPAQSDDAETDERKNRADDEHDRAREPRTHQRKNGGDEEPDVSQRVVHRPRRPPATLFEEPDVRRRVEVTSVRGGQAVFVSRGSGSSAVYLATEDLGEPIEIVPGSAADNASAVLVAETLAVLDRGRQILTLHQSRSEQDLPLPPDFVATHLTDHHDELCVRGRRGHTSAIWLPSAGIDAVWSAPKGGVIEISHISEETVELTVASLIHAPQTVTVKRQHLGACVADALPGLTSWTEWAVADDSVSIPITLCGLSDASGPRPVLTMVYGCYGLSLDAMHDPYLEHLMRAGIILAICGSSELSVGAWG